MGVDIAEFVSARLDEDEQVARGCEHQEWELDGSIRPKGNSGWDQIVDWVYDDEGTTREHIVRHDPARVLREVETKRRIVAIHARRADVFEDGGDGPRANACHGCGYEGDCDDPIVEDVAECPELRAIAAVWTDHPDYREEWRS